LSVRRSGCPLGSHAWILIAMFHLAMDLASCQPPASGSGGRLSPRPVLRHRLSRGSPWGTGSGEELRHPNPPWTCTPVPPLQRPRSRRPPPATPLPAGHPSRRPRSRRGRRHLRGHSFAPRDGRPTALPEVIVIGNEEPGLEIILRKAGCMLSPIASLLPGAADGPTPGRDSGGSGGGVAVRGGGLPPRLPSPLLFLLSAGLAVHQIITITVSLIMVIAALITTLVLKNCCAQSGRPRRNSHQRKLEQQEESCQNLTDFAPARVPSALDIFTAYNETLQCSHECVRTPVPVYAEEVLRSPGDYKTTFNGNRPSSSDRHLIPVAFVSEKWFEISC
ncbi:AJAP1 protein, partial [Pterocles burchelli]|nr:AJAP1 protein [Pterocles burchelli]